MEKKFKITLDLLNLSQTEDLASGKTTNHTKPKQNNVEVSQSQGKR